MLHLNHLVPCIHWFIWISFDCYTPYCQVYSWKHRLIRLSCVWEACQCLFFLVFPCTRAFLSFIYIWIWLWSSIYLLVGLDSLRGLYNHWVRRNPFVFQIMDFCVDLILIYSCLLCPSSLQIFISVLQLCNLLDDWNCMAAANGRFGWFMCFIYVQPSNS